MITSKKKKKKKKEFLKPAPRTSHECEDTKLSKSAPKQLWDRGHHTAYRRTTDSSFLSLCARGGECTEVMVSQGEPLAGHDPRVTPKDCLERKTDVCTERRYGLKGGRALMSRVNKTSKTPKQHTHTHTQRKASLAGLLTGLEPHHLPPSSHSPPPCTTSSSRPNLTRHKLTQKKRREKLHHAQTKISTRSTRVLYILAMTTTTIHNVLSPDMWSRGTPLSWDGVGFGAVEYMYDHTCCSSDLRMPPPSSTILIVMSSFPLATIIFFAMKQTSKQTNIQTKRRARSKPRNSLSSASCGGFETS